ncbi:MAG: 7-carboxy-7-deazaguanine synthase QueE [Pseudomonadota bacterium]
MTIRISEIFGPTIQGEGALIGQPTIFVRTGGCDFRCVWCDTMHAVDSQFRDQWTPMKAEEIFAKIEDLSGKKPLMISLSGGNPAIQDLKPLIDLGHKHEYKFALETQGSIAQDWFADLDVLTLSPKPPSSEMAFNQSKFDECLSAALKNTEKNGTNPDIAIKIVIFDEDDFAFAKNVLANYSQYKFYIQPCNHQVEGEADTYTLAKRTRWLIERVNEEKLFNMTVLPQLHVMLWGNARGV